MPRRAEIGMKKRLLAMHVHEIGEIGGRVQREKKLTFTVKSVKNGVFWTREIDVQEKKIRKKNRSVGSIGPLWLPIQHLAPRTFHICKNIDSRSHRY